MKKLEKATDKLGREKVRKEREKREAFEVLCFFTYKRENIKKKKWFWL